MDDDGDDDSDNGLNFDAFARRIDHHATDAAEIQIGADGELLSTSCNSGDDSAEITNYFLSSLFTGVTDGPTFRPHKL